MATKLKTAEQPTKTYTVTSPLDHDQVLYQPGEPVDLTDAQAAPLLGLAIKANAPDTPAA